VFGSCPSSQSRSGVPIRWRVDCFFSGVLTKPPSGLTSTWFAASGVSSRRPSLGSVRGRATNRSEDQKGLLTGEQSLL
jgi:hypothetical protein